MGYRLPGYSLAHPTTPKAKRSDTHVILANNPSSLVIVHLRHKLGLLLWCGWQLVLEIEDLLEEVGDLLLPHLKVSVLLLDSVLQMHNFVNPSVYLLSSLP
jgi:hypothetical protein